MNYQGIGYTKFEHSGDRPQLNGLESSGSVTFESQSSKHKKSADSGKSDEGSILSNEYDDLADFEGCFENTQSTTPPSPVSVSGLAGAGAIRKRSSSRGIFQALLPRSNGVRRDSTASRPSASNVSLSGSIVPKLKPLRSIGSLRNSTRSSVTTTAQSTATLPILPQGSLGFDVFEWTHTNSPAPTGSMSVSNVRPRGRRSISLTARSTKGKSSRSSKAPRTGNSQLSVNNIYDSTEGSAISNDYQISLANALVAASHSESSKGIHSDLLQILNRDGQSWGFTYGSYPHRLRVWYGDKDERIAESAVRWMEKSMGSDRCQVTVVKNADHSLMYRTAVIVEVLELIHSFW